MKEPLRGYATNKAAPAIAAAFAGQAVVPPPLSVVVLPLCVKKSSVPADSVLPTAVIEWATIAVTEMPETLDPTTQKPGAQVVTGAAELVLAGQK